MFVFRTPFVPKSNIYEVFQQYFLMVIDVSLQSRSVHQLGHARSSPSIALSYEVILGGSLPRRRIEWCLIASNIRAHYVT